MRSDARSANADSVRIEEILRGASRGPMDPDLELTELLAELCGSEDEISLVTALERLARNAHSD
jgi:hypothetical protein